MVGRKKKPKICDKVSHEEDRISQLPEPLISEILSHLCTEDVVRTSVLSTRWRNLWQWVSGLDVAFNTFPNNDTFVSFVERFFDSHKESWIRKLRLNICDPYGNCDLNSWIDVVTRRRIQHLAVNYCPNEGIPLSIYTCKTLVHLRLVRVALANAEFVFFPCMKIMHLEEISYPNETMLQKLISGSPVLEDLTTLRSPNDDKAKVLQVRSHTLKTIYIDESTEVVVDAPLLRCLRTKIYLTKNYKIINLGFSTKLDIGIVFSNGTYGKSLIQDILTDISRVRDLVISNVILKEIFRYSNSGPVLQFRDLLSAEFSKSDLEILPTILESCPKLESFILEMVKDPSMRHEEKREAHVMFSAVPRCLISERRRRLLHGMGLVSNKDMVSAVSIRRVVSNAAVVSNGEDKKMKKKIMNGEVDDEN